jgi:ssDNA-specific exonuclease RecJ
MHSAQMSFDPISLQFAEKIIQSQSKYNGNVERNITKKVEIKLETCLITSNVNNDNVDTSIGFPKLPSWKPFKIHLQSTLKHIFDPIYTEFENQAHIYLFKTKCVHHHIKILADVFLMMSPDLFNLFNEKLILQNDINSESVTSLFRICVELNDLYIEPGLMTVSHNTEPHCCEKIKFEFNVK